MFPRSLRKQVIGPNPTDAKQLSAGERLAEIAEILAAGLMRLQARKSSRKSADFGESSVDLAGHQSGHANPNSLEVEA
jgi:hypothetical protein